MHAGLATRLDYNWAQLGSWLELCRCLITEKSIPSKHICEFTYFTTQWHNLLAKMSTKDNTWTKDEVKLLIDSLKSHALFSCSLNWPGDILRNVQKQPTSEVIRSLHMKLCKLRTLHWPDHVGSQLRNQILFFRSSLRWRRRLTITQLKAAAAACTQYETDAGVGHVVSFSPCLVPIYRASAR